MRYLLSLLMGIMVFMSGEAADANALKVKPQPEKPTTSEFVVEENNGHISAIEYKKTMEELAKIEDELKNKEFTRQTLEDISNFLTEQDIVLDVYIRDVEKSSKYSQDALNALGVAPENTESEDPAIRELREKYTTAMSGYKSRIIEANLLKTEIARVSAMVSDARSHILIGNLIAEKNMIIVPHTFFKAVSDSIVFFWDVTTSPISWYQGLSETDKKDVGGNAWYVLLIIGLALSFGLFLRQYIIRKWGYPHIEDQPRYGQKVVVAVITAIAYGVIPSLLIGGCLLWQVSNASLTHSSFGIVSANILYYALYVTLLRALVRVTLAPWNGRWRLFNISDERAERVFGASTLSIILLCTIGCLKQIAEYYEVSSELSLLLEVTADAIKAFVIVLMTARIFGEIKKKEEPKKEENKPDEEISVSAENGKTESAKEEVKSEVLKDGTKADHEDKKKTEKEEKSEEKEESSSSDDDNETVSSSVKIIIFSSLFAFGTFFISLFGYPELATFVFNRFIISVMMFGVFFIIRKSISDLLRRSIVFWITTFKMRKRLLSKADFLMSLLITPILVLGLIYSLLTLWGVSGNFILHGLIKLIFGFKVGGIEISLISIATGLLTFLISITVVRVLKTRLAKNLLSRINMDEGIKHSLISGLGFVGFIISVILAIVAMGVDLSNLAVIAGALSVGIGFGLQDVIKNLVSGIIILFERPFKVGDWVILGGEEGKIKQINIRSTELETWNKASVIIPNATLISTSLINMTHENNWQRQKIVVGVSYDSDAELVTKTLLECAKSNKRIMKVPAPYVVFKDFGASSLDFELRFYVSDIRVGWSASSELRYEILRRFREENIDIAYPQLVVHKGN